MESRAIYEDCQATIDLKCTNVLVPTMSDVVENSESRIELAKPMRAGHFQSTDQQIINDFTLQPIEHS